MSLRSFFKRFLPEPHRVRNHKHLRHFGDLLHDPGIWHLNRRSASGGIAVGLFCAFIPLPIHMIVAAAVAILFLPFGATPVTGLAAMLLFVTLLFAARVVNLGEIRHIAQGLTK